MSEYVVKSKLEDKEWQIANQVRDHVFVCDDAVSYTHLTLPTN